MIAGFSSGCFEKQWESEVTSNPSVAKVSANNLCMAFDSDKSSANKEYKGKVIIDDKLKAAIDAYYEQYGVKE